MFTAIVFGWSNELLILSASRCSETIQINQSVCRQSVVQFVKLIILGDMMKTCAFWESGWAQASTKLWRPIWLPLDKKFVKKCVHDSNKMFGAQGGTKVRRPIWLSLDKKLAKVCPWLRQNVWSIGWHKIMKANLTQSWQKNWQKCDDNSDKMFGADRQSSFEM